MKGKSPNSPSGGGRQHPVRTLISLQGGVISNPLRRLPHPASFELKQGEIVALVGPNGGGKSTLLEMIRGGFYLREGSLRFDLDDEPYRAIRTVAFDNAYSTTETQYYYQQRWQAFERDASPLAGELLGVEAEAGWRERLFVILNIRPLLAKPIITLSSGELRRFSIARALLHHPQALLLENPFIGLDPPTRQLLCDLLEHVNGELGISCVMTLTDPARIPPVVTHVYFMEGGTVSEKIPAGEFSGNKQYEQPEIRNGRQCATEVLPTLPRLRETPLFDKVVEMRNVNISYGPRQIFRDLCWTVRSCETWNVTGPNGSGKSTLLSLVNADNPRAYSLDITLFDHRRGTGESIWDIKRHIGYLSSEMHSSFITTDTALEVVRSGLDCSLDNDEYLMQWLRLFGAEHLAQRSYNTLSSGEQRYVLLVRSFVKDPDLLILDEPFQGLDPDRRTTAATIIKAWHALPGKTLIFVTHYIDEIPDVVTHTLQL
ncbi:MAG: ATP-binding cassette domain-containing protein [Bacteroidales bacterium]|nr:ATP-binding cassette domain-containing protein [Bacteroidales bacterium]